MNEFFGSLWWLLVSLGVLITIHEFGHFWVARRCGVKVLRFSIGFGKALWKRTGRDGTEYVIAAIPLGGYVRMLDEREGDVAPHDARHAFNRQSVWRRIAIVVAGPLANLLLCVALLWAMFVIGRPDYAPVIGAVEGIAARAGVREGDTVLAVGGRAVATWTEVEAALLPAALDREDVALAVRTAAGDTATRTLRLSQLPRTLDELRAVRGIGLVPRHFVPPPVIDAVVGPPALGVLRPGDRLLVVDGAPIRRWQDIAPLVQAAGTRGVPVRLEVERAGRRISAQLRPQPQVREGERYWALGIQSRAPEHDAVLRHAPLAAMPAAAREAAHQTGELFAMIGRAFSGKVSVQNTVAGPLTIARAANAFAQQGPAWFLSMLALLSLSLGILNLLPIPILDGGHLLYYLIELIKGSPVSERVMAAGQYVGLAVIVGLMGLAFYNDIVNNLVR
ncbi:MAG TPA: RIP metalloprotease RseP [Lysobacter sp.]|nr:RIP metalloprotease RseP [Lysobacter sp.]